MAFGFVHDFGAGEQWWAYRGRGRVAQRRAAGPVAARAALARRQARAAGNRVGRPALGGGLDRRRWCAPPTGCGRLGTIAGTLCQVAAARFDGMVTLRRCRGVDAAAGQLIVREAGGLVSFTDCADPLGAPLDADARARTWWPPAPRESLRELRAGSRA